ncbi:MAG: hypothetical protein QF894_11180 [Alphaproteobacteria bacterium]|jgi:hypothetical protein|nr:hypothetical protein [Alphaproteobacteria bacterium]
MRDSKNRPRTKRAAGLLGGILLAALLAGSAGPSPAQTEDSDAPLRLVPLEEEAAPDETSPQTDAEADADAEAEPLVLDIENLAPPEEVAEESGANSRESDGAGVEVGTLDAIAADDVGLLDERSGGFADTLWQRTRRDIVKLLLPRLPIEARSPAMRSAALKLLLSPGKAPRGAGGAGGESGELLRLRAEVLARMGEYDVAIALLRAAPGGDFEEVIARYDNDRMFLKLDFTAACEQARARIDLSPDAHWQRALILCQSREEEVEAASLGLDLLRESDYAPDAAFVTLINAMNGYGEAALESLPNPTPMLVSMLRILGIQAPLNALDAANPALLRLIAGAADSDIGLRLAAAEQAEAVGALPAASVGALYAEVQFSAEERADPLGYSALIEGPLARAILYQAILTEDVPTARAEAVGVALQRAQEEARFATMARVLLPALQAIPAVREFAWFAGDAGRAYFAAGRWEEARRWFDVALAGRGANQEARQAAIALWPLVALTGQENEIDAAMLADWWQAQGGAMDPVAHRQGGLLLTLLSALGRNVSPEQWDTLLAGPLSEPSAVASPALRHALRAAASDRRLGEVVLLALLDLGAGGPQNAALITLGETIAGLRDVGLERDAQAIAVEAALAGGL